MQLWKFLIYSSENVSEIRTWDYVCYSNLLGLEADDLSSFGHFPSKILRVLIRPVVWALASSCRSLTPSNNVPGLFMLMACFDFNNVSRYNDEFTMYFLLASGSIFFWQKFDQERSLLVPEDSCHNFSSFGTSYFFREGGNPNDAEISPTFRNVALLTRFQRQRCFFLVPLQRNRFLNFQHHSNLLALVQRP